MKTAADNLAVVRVAAYSDAASIAHLHASSWRIAYRGVLTDAYLDGDVVAERTALWEARLGNAAVNQYVVVAETNRAVVGFACAYGAEDPDWGTLLDNLHVAHAHKGAGVGSRLMAHTAAWCASAHPATGMYLWVLEPNSPARRFYERLGAVEMGRDTWSSPDGGSVQKIRYTWRSLPGLLKGLEGHARERLGRLLEGTI